MKVIIIGGGETGLSLANLLGDNFAITIIEKSEEKAKDIANKTHALVIHGDGTDVTVLKEAGVHDSDAIVATSREDSVNLMICELSKNENIKKIITTVNSPKDEEIFAKLGVKTISVVGTNVTAIKQALHEVGTENILIQWGDIEVIQEKVGLDSPLVGKSAELKDAVICGLSREGELTLPSGTEIQAGDVLLVSLKSSDVQDVLKTIRGK